MTDCIITLKSGEVELAKVSVDPSLDLTDDLLVSLLKQLNLWNNFLKNLEKSLHQNSISTVKFNTLMEQDRLIPNASIDNLKNRFSRLGDIFPDETEEFKYSDFQILYINKYVTKGGDVRFGIYENPNGKKIYVLDNSSIYKFAKYLELYKSIVSDNITDKIIEEDRKTLLQILSLTSFKTFDELLIDYIGNTNKYASIYVNGLNAYSILSELCNDLLGILKLRKYNSPIIDNISTAIDYDKGYRSGTISTENLIKVIKEDSDLYELLTKHFGKDLKTFFNKSVKDNLEKLQNSKLFNNLDPEKDSWEVLYSYIIDQDPNFRFKFESYKRGLIKVKKKYTTLENSEIGFSSTLKLDNPPQYYHGLYITKISKKTDLDEDVYVVTKYYPRKKSIFLRFKTEEQCKLFIDSWSKIEGAPYLLYSSAQDDSANTYIYVDEKNTINEGEIIKVLDISSLGYSLLNLTNKIFNKNELYLQLSISLNSEDADIIIENLDTPEKAYLFIQLTNGLSLNDDEDSDSEKYITLSRKLKELNKYKYYYVKSKHELSGKIQLTLFRPDLTTSTESSLFNSVQTIFEAFSTVLGPKLGINIEYAPYNILKEKVKLINSDFKIEKNCKAFILNNENGRPTVYINSTNASSKDFIHEYSHIFLAYLRNKDYDRYMEILLILWDNSSEDELQRIMKLYKNYPRLMQVEELFVSKFSEWANGRGLDWFSTNIDLEEFCKTLDSNNKSFEIKDLMNLLLGSFVLFNNEVNGFLTNGETLGGEFKNTFKADRLKILWIRLLIHDKNIEEIC